MSKPTKYLRRLILMIGLVAGTLLYGQGHIVYGQAVNGSLLGTITDSKGAVLPGATVVITEINTNVTRTDTANADGNYTFSNLTPGVYRVEAEHPGFKKTVHDRVEVLVNSTVRSDIELLPGAVSEQVTITEADQPVLQTDRSDTGRKIETKQLEDLPVPPIGGARNFQALIELVPGSTRPFRPHSEFFNPQNALAFQVNGSSRLGNNLQLEGIDDNERTGLLQVLLPPVESIRTVDVTTSNFDAELGRATGAVTNVILKSGTNQWHGAGYWYNRVSALSSRPYFDPVRPHFVYNYLGGQVGGPIRKNKTFIFGDYLRITDHRFNGDRYTVPTMAERGGDLRVSPTLIYDPRTGNPNGTGRQVISCNGVQNVICPDRIDPIAAKILSLVPAPNQPGLTNNLFMLIPFTRTTDQFDVKVDHNQTANDHFLVRFSFERPVTFDASSFGQAGGPHGGGFQGTGVQNTYSTGVNYTHIFSSTLLTEVRVGVNRYRNDARQVDYGKKDAEALGVPGVNVSDFTSGQVGVNLNGGFSNPIIGYSASLPWVRAETNINLVNNWTKTKGNHTFRWGGDLRRIRDDLLQTQTFSPRGLFNFGSAQTSIPGASTSFGNNLASFLLGLPSQVGRDLPVIFPAYRAWEVFTYFRDKWVVTPRLTLDLGLRWEFYPPATPAHTGGFSNYDPATNSLIIAGIGNNPMDLGLKKHYKDFAPRFGLAYRFKEKTVFRVGFGISYTPYPDNTYAYNFPVKQNNAFNPNNSFGPAVLPNGQPATFAAGFPPPTLAVIPSNGIISNADVNQVYEVINHDFREPYVESWNVAIQRSLPLKFVLEAAYVGNHGVAQPALFNLNASRTLGADVNGQPLFRAFGRKADTNLRYVGYSSSYNALQVKFDRRFTNGLAVTTAYTWSKALGYQDEDAGITFYINPQRNWHVLGFSRKHVFVQSYVYELPFGSGHRFLRSGPASWILGGWQVNGILSISSGTPLNFGGNTAGLRAPGNGNTLNRFGPIQILGGTGREHPWFDPTRCNSDPSKGPVITDNCFSQPGALQFGNLGLNPIYGPGTWNIDASLFRRVRLTERIGLELRGEAYNVTNSPIWSNPDTGIGSSTFGFITGTQGGSNRIIQLGMKLTF